MTSTSEDDDRTAAAEALCRACGMCCDGTLFELGRVEAQDDVPSLTARGLLITERQGRTFFQQPCTCFAGDTCAIYKARPSRCRQYRCQVLADLEDGAIAPADAHALVGRALSWRRVLIGELGDRFGGASLGLAARWRAVQADNTVESRTRVLFGGLVAFLESRFRQPSNRDQGSK